VDDQSCACTSVAVGAQGTLRPRNRSVRAGLPHTAPALGMTRLEGVDPAGRGANTDNQAGAVGWNVGLGRGVSARRLRPCALTRAAGAALTRSPGSSCHGMPSGKPILRSSRLILYRYQRRGQRAASCGRFDPDERTLEPRAAIYPGERTAAFRAPFRMLLRPRSSADERRLLVGLVQAVAL
jgi:hypothetical protein